MKTNKAKNRDKKRSKRRYGMRVDGKSVFLTVQILVEKAKKLEKENKHE
jgi:hypothetical protein